MPVKIFVGNLSDDTAVYQLQPLFDKYGTVTECDVLRNFGFVHMQTDEEADEAIKNLNGYHLNGQKIRVEKSTGKTREDGFKWGRGGRGRGGGPMRGMRGRGRGGYPSPYERFPPPPPPGYERYDPYYRYLHPYYRDYYERDPYYPPPPPRGDRYGARLPPPPPPGDRYARERPLPPPPERRPPYPDPRDRLPPPPPRDRYAPYPDERRLPPPPYDRDHYERARPLERGPPADPYYRERSPLGRPPPEYYERPKSDYPGLPGREAPPREANGYEYYRQPRDPYDRTYGGTAVVPAPRQNNPPTSTSHKFDSQAKLQTGPIFF